MGHFEKEFDQRLRRVCGVTDDSMYVKYDMDYEESGYYGCDTCGNYTDGGTRIIVTISQSFPAGRNKTRKLKYIEREFKDLGELMRAMDEVEL